MNSHAESCLFGYGLRIISGSDGKGGGVKLAASPEEAEARASDILGMKLRTPQTGGGAARLDGRQFHGVRGARTPGLGVGAIPGGGPLLGP